MASQAAPNVHEDKLTHQDAHSFAEKKQNPKSIQTDLKDNDFDSVHSEEYTQPTPKYLKKHDEGFDLKLENEQEGGDMKHSGLNVHAAPFVSTNTFHSGNSTATTQTIQISPTHLVEMTNADPLSTTTESKSLSADKTTTDIHPSFLREEKPTHTEATHQAQTDFSATRPAGLKDEFIGGIKKIAGQVVGSDSLKTQGQLQLEKGKEEIAAAKAQKENLSPRVTKDGKNDTQKMKMQEDNDTRGLGTKGVLDANTSRQPLTPRQNNTENTSKNMQEENIAKNKQLARQGYTEVQTGHT